MSNTQGAELGQFIPFVACLGQSKMANLGYTPLPPNLVEDDFQAAGRLPGGTTPAAADPNELQKPDDYAFTYEAEIANNLCIDSRASRGRWSAK